MPTRAISGVAAPRGCGSCHPGVKVPCGRRSGRAEGLGRWHLVAGSSNARAKAFFAAAGRSRESPLIVRSGSGGRPIALLVLPPVVKSLRGSRAQSSCPKHATDSGGAPEEHRIRACLVRAPCPAGAQPSNGVDHVESASIQRRQPSGACHPEQRRRLAVQGSERSFRGWQVQRPAQGQVSRSALRQCDVRQ